jgi:putative two-component system response regulator
MEIVIGIAGLLAGWLTTHIYYRLSQRKNASAIRALGDAIENIREGTALTVTPMMAVDTITTLLDYHEPGSKDHLRRVGRYASALARRLGLREEDMKRIELAAYLHDIGKISVARDVLFKPSRLTDEEVQVMKEHAALGGRIVENIDSEIAAIIRHHHEHFDGSGYPNGLRGEAIPLGSRIVAVADAFDALTTDRPYRTGRTHPEAFALLREYVGTYFDPAVLTAFAAVLGLS